MKRILLIDDDVDILTILQLVLTVEGFMVQAYSKWQEIFSKVTTFQPSLILLDVSLGTADGRNLAKLLKSDNSTKHIPIILLSAKYNGRENLLECEADDFIAKPFDLHHLVEKVMSYTS